MGGGGYLDNLSYQPPERALLNSDATRFPGWQLQTGGDPDWLIFSDGDQPLRIGNVDSTPLEEVLGVDLIYRHVEADTFVLVQYKRMVKEQDGNWWYRPDDQLLTEIERMERIDSIPDAPRPTDPPPGAFIPGPPARLGGLASRDSH